MTEIVTYWYNFWKFCQNKNKQKSTTNKQITSLVFRLSSLGLTGLNKMIDWLIGAEHQH